MLSAFLHVREEAPAFATLLPLYLLRAVQEGNEKIKNLRSIRWILTVGRRAKGRQADGERKEK